MTLRVTLPRPSPRGPPAARTQWLNRTAYSNVARIIRVEVDEESCCAAGQCVLAAPTVFGQRDDDGVVVVLMEKPPEELRPAVEEAAFLCPASVIVVKDH